MRQVGDMKLYSFEEVKDGLLGKIGTPERNRHDGGHCNLLKHWL